MWVRVKTEIHYIYFELLTKKINHDIRYFLSFTFIKGKFKN